MTYGAESEYFLETERLILRPMQSADLDKIFAIRSDAEMMRLIKPPENIELTKRWLNYVSSRWKTEKIGFRAVVHKQKSCVIGWCGLWKLPETDETEIGYAIHKDFQRQGLAVEAAFAVLVEGFEKLGASRIVAIAMPENTASHRVMEKIGLSFERVGWFYERECVYYALDRKNFVKNRQSAQTVSGLP